MIDTVHVLDQMLKLLLATFPSRFFWTLESYRQRWVKVQTVLVFLDNRVLRVMVDECQQALSDG